MIRKASKTITEVNGQAFLDDIVKKWWYCDLEKAIVNGSNYLAALELCEYSEIMGWLLTGMPKNPKGECSYKKFIKTMDDSMNIIHYTQIDKELIKKFQSDNKSYEYNKKGLYGRVRCGLAHEYFIKGNSEVFKKEDNVIYGIEYDYKDDYIWFSCRKYFEEFKKTIDYIEKNKMLSHLEPIQVKISGNCRTSTSYFPTT